MNEVKIKLGDVVDYDEGNNQTSPSVNLEDLGDGRNTLLVCSKEPGVPPRVENGVSRNDDGGGHTWRPVS